MGLWCDVQVQMSLEECVAEFAKVIKVIRLMTATATQLIVTLTGWTCLCYLVPSVRVLCFKQSKCSEQSVQFE